MRKTTHLAAAGLVAVVVLLAVVALPGLGLASSSQPSDGRFALVSNAFVSTRDNPTITPPINAAEII